MRTPDELTIGKNYVEKVSNTVLEQIRAKLHGKDIYITVDETTDPLGRFTVNVLLGQLSSER